jgi:ABC-type amino acid transport system permease subunit
MIAGIALVLWLIDAWDIDKVTTYGPKFLSGLGTTLTLVGISITLGALFSVPIAFGRMSSNRFLSSLALWLCLFLPRHTADRAAFPDLLWLRHLPRSA